MKVCLMSRVYSSSKAWAGIGSYTYYMAHSLTNLGHEVHIITQGSSEGLEYNENGVFVHRFAYYQPLNFLFNYWGALGEVEDRIWYSKYASSSVKRIIKKYDIEVVEAPEFFAEGLIFSYSKPTPLIVRCHAPFSLISMFIESYSSSTRNVFKKMYKGVIRRLATSFESSTLGNASCIISVSHALAEYIKSEYNISEIIVIHNGIDVDKVKSYCSGGFRKKWNLESCTMILYVGRLEKLKGYLTLARAANTIFGRYPHVKIVFLGTANGNQKESALNLIDSQYRDKVIFTGDLPYSDTISAIDECDVLCVPSLWESCSYVILEGMACGKAIVASKVGGIIEQIEDGKSGILFRSESQSDLELKINLLLTDDALRKNLEREAYLRARELFSSQIMAQRTLEIYNKVTMKT